MFFSCYLIGVIRMDHLILDLALVLCWIAFLIYLVLRMGLCVNVSVWGDCSLPRNQTQAVMDWK